MDTAEQQTGEATVAVGGEAMSMDIPGIEVAGTLRPGIFRLSRELPRDDRRRSFMFRVGKTYFLADSADSLGAAQDAIIDINTAVLTAKKAKEQAEQLAKGLGLGDAAMRDVLAGRVMG